MNRLTAIKTIIDKLEGSECLIHANGAISRESFCCSDRIKNFYLLGSMGLPASVALGLALQVPEKKVIIMDGDGNLLMGFGNLAQIGALKPVNILHIVFDNQVYGTTGNQPTISSDISLDRIAKAAGYKNCYCIHQQDELEIIFPTLLEKVGPNFLQIKIDSEVSKQCPSIPYPASKIKDRFTASLAVSD